MPSTSFIITPNGEHWLIYGSWHSGIAAVQLNPETGKTLKELPKSYGTADEIAPYGKLIFTRTNGSRWQGAEAPEVVYHDGYYYLFLAYDGLDVPYNTRVLRSKNVDGPYETMNNRVTNAANGAGDNPTVLTHPYKFSQGYGWVGISTVPSSTMAMETGTMYLSSVCLPMWLVSMQAMPS